MNEAEVMLSVIIPVYNHEKYIAKALDSVLMQKTRYSFEVLVGDDVSTDNSRAILKEYEEKHPGFFKMFYREHNMHREAINNSKDLVNRACGKYLITLEGDDYWLDEYKIEKQVAFLEEHPDYLAVAHNCIIVDDDSNPTGETYPECKDEEYTIWHYANEILPGQTATLMCRNYVKNALFDRSLMNLNLAPGDRRKIFTLITNGKVYCIQEAMSAYRHVTTHGSSYSANIKYQYSKTQKWYAAQLEYAYKLNHPDAIKCAELQYALEIRSAVLKKRVKMGQAMKDLKILRHRLRSAFSVLKRDIRRVFKRK